MQRCRGFCVLMPVALRPWLTVLYFLHVSHLSAPGSTRRKYKTCAEDKQLEALIAAGTECVCIFAKAWALHVDDILEVRVAADCDGGVLIDPLHRFIGVLPGSHRYVVFIH